VLPEDAREKQNDYVMLSDILPTGYHGTELAQVGFGESVVIWGAGPVGLMAAMSRWAPARPTSSSTTGSCAT
jgi:glutathione-independent formaldehyde dehydrogenase